MQITLNEDDRESIANMVAGKLESRILLALASSAGYEAMLEEIKKFTNLHTSETMVNSAIRAHLSEIVAAEVRTAFNKRGGDANEWRDKIRVTIADSVQDMVGRIVGNIVEEIKEY